jgi:hypothetical protein
VRAKHLYRVTATYPDGGVWRRDYQRPLSARERRDSLMTHEEMTGVVVTITRSDPITWPTS